MGPKPSLTMATLFGQVHHFRLDGLLAVGQMMIIDENRGTVQVSPGECIVQLHEVERCLVRAFAQSSPYPVERYQMLALSTSQGIVETKEALASALQKEGAYEQLMQPVRELLATCNCKLKPLGIAIQAFNQEREFLLGKAQAHDEQDHATPTA